MPDVLFEDFTGGVNTRGTVAPPNTASYLRGVDIENGGARVIVPPGNAFPGLAENRVPTDLHYIGGHLIGVAASTPPAIGRYRKSGSNWIFEPIWPYRGSGGISGATIGRNMYFTPNLPDSAFEESFPIRWRDAIRTGQLQYSHDTGEGYQLFNTTAQTVDDVAMGLYLWGIDASGVFWGPTRITHTGISPSGPLNPQGHAIQVVPFPVVDPSTLVSFVSVHVDRIGQPAPYKPGVTLTSGGSLDADTEYRYLVRYVSTLLRTAGNPSEFSNTATTTGANKRIEIVPNYLQAHMDLRRETPRVTNRIEVYRSKKISGAWDVFRLIHDEPIHKAAGGYHHKDMQPVIVDDGKPDGEILAADAYHHERPGRIRLLRSFNGRLFGVSDTNPNRLRFSTMAKAESWPQEVVDVTSSDTNSQWLGGYVSIGDESEILALVPEGGTFSNTGTTGANLLVMKRRASFRFSGFNWSNFAQYEAFPMGCASGRSVVNCNGVIYWVEGNHVMRVVNGSNLPEIASLEIWPMGNPSGHDDAAMRNYKATFWNNNYVISGLVADGTGGVMQYNPRTHAWMPIHHQTVNFLLAGAPPFSPNALVGGQHEFFTSTTFNPTFQIMTRRTRLSASPKDLPRRKRLLRAILCIENDTGRSQTITMGITGPGLGLGILKNITVNTGFQVIPVSLLPAEPPLPGDQTTPLDIILNLSGTMLHQAGGNRVFWIRWVLLEYELLDQVKK